MTLPKKRNRAKRPTWSFSGLTAAEWKTTSELVKWAQDAPQFRGLVTLLVNDKGVVLDALGGLVSESRLLGRHEAYEAVRLHLLSLAEGLAPPQEDVTRTATYESVDDADVTTVESDFVNTEP